MPDSGAVETDTLTYRIESEECKISRYSKTHVYSEHQEYTFKKKNNGNIYKSSGYMLRKDYVRETHIEVTYKTNAAGDTLQIDSTYSTIGYRPGSSSATLGYFKYELNKSKNKLTIFYGKQREEYQVLFLSSKMLMMRKID
jgi:hypothetical protein